MSFHAVLHGCNAICYQKNYINYGMTCSWVMMIDYDKIAILMGGQSQTGNHINKGDIIGVSGLAKNQKEIALQLGSFHSETKDKFLNIKYSVDHNAILIDNAKTNMVCLVKDILHLDGNLEDNFLVCEIISKKEKNSLEFLSLEEVY